MAGKTWSEEEEEYFWVHIVPFSRRRRGLDLANPELSFRQLAEKMWEALGEKARRRYTGLTLEEHFYQNIETGRISKNAHKWVKQYKAIANEYPDLPVKCSRATHEANNEVEATHVATKPGAETDWELGGDENAAKRAAILKLTAPGGQEQSNLAEDRAAADDGLFAGPPDPTTAGYDSDRTVTDVSDEVIGGGTKESGKGRSTEVNTNHQDNANAGRAPSRVNQDGQEAVQDTVVVGGFSYFEDGSSADDEDSDYQPDENEPAN